MTAQPFFFDSRRKIAILPTQEELLEFAANQFVKLGIEAIQKRGGFFVALSGGSTPKSLYSKLAKEKREALDWSKVHLYFSDERQVPPDDPQSNYRMAMEAGFSALPIPKEQIHRMKAEGNIEENALTYEKLLEKLPGGSFDLMMLGMGEDGHTASLFPKTEGLHSDHRLVIANFIPEKKSWRMSLTFECINHARAIVVYLIGKSKAEMAERVLYGTYEPDLYPIQRVGTETNPALFLFDREAAPAKINRN